MSFLKTNPVSVDTPTKKSQYDSVFENTQLAYRLLCVSGADSNAIANTAAETAFSRAWTMPGGTIDRAGSVLTIRSAGQFSNTGTPTLRLKIKIGSSTVLDNGGQTTASGASSWPWFLEYRVLVRTIGSSTQITYGGFWWWRDGVYTQPVYGNPVASSSVNFDPTVDNLIQVTAQWGAANTLNTTVMKLLAVELGAPEVTI